MFDSCRGFHLLAGACLSVAIDDPSLIPAIASAIAAIASAVAAGMAINVAKQAERRSILRELHFVIQSLGIELAAIETLKKQVVLEVQSLGALAGSSGGSAESQTLEKIRAMDDSIGAIHAATGQFSVHYDGMKRGPIETLSEYLSKFQGHLAALRSHREQSLLQLNTISTQTQLYRQRKLGN
jgi:hypothetical protein